MSTLLNRVTLERSHFDGLLQMRLQPPCLIDRQDHWLQFEPLCNAMWYVLAKCGQSVPRWSLAVIENLRKRGPSSTYRTSKLGKAR